MYCLGLVWVVVCRLVVLLFGLAWFWGCFLWLAVGFVSLGVLGN